MKKLIAVLFLASYSLADCTEASLTWSQDYSSTPVLNAVCGTTVNTNCYTRFLVVDPDPVTGGSFPVAITSVPSPLAVVEGITSGFFRSIHASGTSWTFQVFTEAHDGTGAVVKSKLTAGSTITATCGVVTPTPTIPGSPSNIVVVTR